MLKLIDLIQVFVPFLMVSYIQWWIIHYIGVIPTIIILMFSMFIFKWLYDNDYTKKYLSEKYHDRIKWYITIYNGTKIFIQKYYGASYDTYVKINQSNKSLSITYTYLGQVYLINLPYNSSKLIINRSKKVYLVNSKHEIDITQQPGIPYMCSSHELGGESIIIKDLSGEIIKKYSYNQIPTL